MCVCVCDLNQISFKERRTQLCKMHISILLNNYQRILQNVLCSNTLIQITTARKYTTSKRSNIQKLKYTSEKSIIQNLQKLTRF